MDKFKFSIRYIGKADAYDYKVLANDVEVYRVASNSLNGIILFLKQAIPRFYTDKMYKKLNIK